MAGKSVEFSEEQIQQIETIADHAHRDIGANQPICPMVSHFLVLTHPDSPLYDESYKNRVEQYLKDEVGAKNVSIDPAQFHERVKDLCRGIAYVFNKEKNKYGPGCLSNLSRFFIANKAQLQPGKPPADFFYAMVAPHNDGSYEMVLQSGIFALHSQKDCRVRDRVFNDDKIPGQFNAREMLMLIGAEEAMHMIQMTQGRHVSYNANEVMQGNKHHHKKYQSDPMELEVKEVLQDMARDLKLGSEYGRPMGNPHASAQR